MKRTAYVFVMILAVIGTLFFLVGEKLEYESMNSNSDFHDFTLSASLVPNKKNADSHELFARAVVIMPKLLDIPPCGIESGHIKVVDSKSVYISDEVITDNGYTVLGVTENNVVPSDIQISGKFEVSSECNVGIGSLQFDETFSIKKKNNNIFEIIVDALLSV